MTRIGLLRPNSEATRLVVSRLGNDWAIGRAGLHPLQILAPALTYNSGGHRAWTPLPAVSEALDRAFYLSLANVPRTGKRFYLALDVSSSMDHGEIPGVPGLTLRLAAAAMTLVTARAERDTYVGAFSHGMAPLAVTASDTLRALVDQTRRLPAGETDCALPILDAAARGIETDIFVILTGSQTEAGATHPVEALCRYREQTGIAAKLLVVGMLANHFSIADAGDAGTLDVVGFDAATPNLIAGFATA
jgi:60 kDa SS-A/Ro ribonucleoprotein